LAITNVTNHCSNVFEGKARKATALLQIKVSMTEEKDDSNAVYPGGERKLSIPYSVQRRKYGSLDTHSRAVVVAVDPSERAKAAFLCTFVEHHNLFRKRFQLLSVP